MFFLGMGRWGGRLWPCFAARDLLPGQLQVLVLTIDCALLSMDASISGSDEYAEAFRQEHDTHRATGLEGETCAANSALIVWRSRCYAGRVEYPSNFTPFTLLHETHAFGGVLTPCVIYTRN